jgi:SAM-dependent methyltransferase
MTAIRGNGPVSAAGQKPAVSAGRGLDPAHVYALGADPDESARLTRQSDELRPEADALLARIGLRPGQAVADLGCGPRGILELLSGAVAPGGRVLGLDADPAHVAMAAAGASRSGLGNVEVIQGDARHTGLPSGSFDLVHARTLLVTIPEPAEVLAEMARLARPGGWVASLEPDAECGICYPRCPPGTGSGRSSRPASPGRALTCASAAAWPRCTGRRGWPTSECRCTPAPILRGTRAARSSRTWCAASAR